MRRLTKKQIEVADEIVDKLAGEIGDELVAIWLFNWEQSDPFFNPFFHVICSLDCDEDILFDKKDFHCFFDCVEEIERAHGIYIEKSIVSESGYWDVLYDVYHFDEDKAIKYYHREQKTVIRDSKFRGTPVSVKSELWAMNCENIRQAVKSDISRIAEIEVFCYRNSFYPIYKDEEFFFGELQAEREAEKLRADEELLQYTYVYDDGVVKGFILIDGDEVWKLFVEPAFHRQSIGSELLEFAEEMHGVEYLWVLERNESAISFYKRHGFEPTGERILDGTVTDFLIRMKRKPIKVENNE